MKSQYLIIVAGGTGSRMNRGFPKQFLELQGEVVIIRVMRRFLDYNNGLKLIISVHSHYLLLLEELIAKAGLPSTQIQITTGGDTRYDSVKNGLKLVHEDDAIVGIHDAARPFVSIATIRNCYEGAARHGNAIPVVLIPESLRRVAGEKNQAVSRDEYRIIQTPQCFLAGSIKKAFEQPYRSSFTDDATVLETMGEAIHLVEGNAENIKLTTPHDLLIANALVDHEQ